MTFLAYRSKIAAMERRLAYSVEDCLDYLRDGGSARVVSRCINTVTGKDYTVRFEFPQEVQPETRPEPKPRVRRSSTFRGDVGSAPVAFRSTSSQVALVQGNVLRLGR